MAQTNPDKNEKDRDACDPCDAESGAKGPPREGGGTIGAGNLSPEQASRTGGATGGVDDDAPPMVMPRRGVEPDA